MRAGVRRNEALAWHDSAGSLALCGRAAGEVRTGCLGAHWRDRWLGVKTAHRFSCVEGYYHSYIKAPLTDGVILLYLLF